MVEAVYASPTHGGRVRHGVSIEAWAFVLAGVGDGLEEEELLGHLGIGEERWRLASAAFEEDVLDDVEAGGTLTEALDEAMRAARKSWSPPIPPLDVDLQAWLDFYRACSAAESPMEFLEAHELRATDIHRLQDHWTAKLAKDEALRNAAVAILQAPPGPVTRPTPEPARLLASATAGESVDVTRAPKPRAADTPLPFSEGEPAPAHPRLSVSLPMSRKIARRSGADETRLAPPAESGALVLPFLAPEPGGGQPEPTPSAPEAGREEGERVPLSIERYAALCVDLIEAPEAHDPVLRRYGITAAEKLALDVHWTQRMAEDVTTWLAWDRASAQHRSGKTM